MNSVRKRRLFDLLGGGLVVVWVIMIGLLIQKAYFNKVQQPIEITNNKADVIKGIQDRWMSIYLNDDKVGYSMTRISPVEEGYLIYEEIVLNLRLLGQSSVLRTSNRSVVDQGFMLKQFMAKIDSGVVSFQASGEVEGLQMRIEMGEKGKGKKKESFTIRLSEPPVMGSALSHFFRGRTLEPGRSFRFLMFDPSTMAQKSVIFRVVSKESLTLNGVKYPAFRLETKMWGQDLIFWLDEKGEILREQGLMGLTLVRSNPSAAPRDLKGDEGYDLYEMASIPVKPRIRDPRRLSFLKLEVEGLDKTPFNSVLLNQGRQRFRDGILEIAREKRPLKAPYTVPFANDSGEMGPYLKPSLNIQSEDEAIVTMAREIMGNQREPVRLARRLMAWVYHQVEKKPVVSVPSALEVLKTRVGDCNEHTVLLTALLRACGIPARECVGVVYARGRFYYHAWTEAYLGSWISMDPTLNQMPTDATHIAMVRGGLDKQTDIISLLGKLKFKVLDYGYD